MIDIELIRDKKDYVIEKLNTRAEDYSTIIDEIYSIDFNWRKTKKMLDSLRAERNNITKSISEKKKRGLDASNEIKKSKEIGKLISDKEKQEKGLLAKRNTLLLLLPNIPSDLTPIGKSEDENIVVKEEGKPKLFQQDVLPHYEVGEREGVLDFKRGSKLGGHRFTVMRSWASKLERALINFMLDIASSNGYEEYWLPHLVKTEVITGTGQLPKFKEDLYKTDDNLWLIPTAEVPLTNLHRNEVLEEISLPKKYVAYTPSYRKEAGAYGKDIKGIIRQHQFDKVELVKLVHPEDSFRELEEMRKDAEKVLKLLNLPYRVVKLCTGDLGFSSSLTYDLEVWIPSQNKYREISSISNCTDFQARRMNTKFRSNKGVEYIHTLNGSALAVGRTLVAIMENYQEERGISIPDALQDYFKSDFIHFNK